MDPLNFTHGHSNGAGGVDKPRGLENARLQHERERPARPRDGVGPAAVVSLAGGAHLNSHVRSASDPDTARTEATSRHVAPHLASVDGSRALMLGEAANLQVNTGTESAGGSGTLIVGAGANVHINTRGESGGGSGTLIVGEDANVHINSRFGGAGGSGTLIVGAGANVHINTRGESGGGSGTLIVGEGANVHVNARLASVDLQGTGVVANEAKLHVNARAETAAVSDGRAVSPRTVEEAAELALRERGRHVVERQQPPAPARIAQTVLEAPPNDPDALARTRPSSLRDATESLEAPAYMDPRLGMMRELIDSARQGWEERAAKEPRGPKGAKAESDAREAQHGSEAKGGAPSEDLGNHSGPTRAAETAAQRRGRIGITGAD